MEYKKMTKGFADTINQMNNNIFITPITNNGFKGFALTNGQPRDKSYYGFAGTERFMFTTWENAYTALRAVMQTAYTIKVL